MILSKYVASDEEAAASKRMDVLSTFSRNYEYPLSFPNLSNKSRHRP